MDIKRSFVFISKNHKLKLGLAFNDLILDNSITPTRSVFRSEITFSMIFTTLYSVLLSAKLQTLDFLINKNKLFINMLKSRGPSKDPYGTPRMIGLDILSISYPFNLAIKRSCGIQSYALDRSIKFVATIAFSSNSFCHDCSNLNNACCVLRTFQKPRKITLKIFST